MAALAPHAGRAQGLSHLVEAGASGSAGSSAMVARRGLVALAVLGAIVVLSLAKVSALHTPLMFDDLFGRGPGSGAATRLLGHPRFVRGDEFAVETPVALGQERAGFPEHMTVGTVQDDDVHAYAPGGWASVPWRPLDVWFHLLPAASAVVARSWSVFALAFAAFYVLVRFVDARLRRGVAVLLALGGVFSPPLVWWFTTTHWLAVSFGILGPIAVVAGRTRRSAVVGAAAGGYLLALGAMTTYPAFFLSCALTTSLVVVGTWWRGEDRVLRAGVAAVVLAVVAGSYYRANSALFKAVLDTVYPGGRTSVSGEDRPVRAFTGPFLRYRTSNVPPAYANQTEQASPLYVFPLAALALVAARAWRPRVEVRRAVLGAVAALVILWGWAFGWLPTFAGRLIGFNGVPGARTVMALVIVCTVVGAGVLGSEGVGLRGVGLRGGGLGGGRWVGGAAVVVAGGALLVWEGRAVRSNVGAHALAWRDVALWTVLFLGVVVVVVLGRRASARAGAVALLSMALTVGVHPVSIGLGSGDRIARAIRSLDAAQGHPGRWLANDDVRLNAVVMASGVPTWSGVHFVPDRPMWKVLDPSGRREHEWNRYAHVIFRLRDGADQQAAPVIDAVQSDAIVVHIGICRPELATLHVARIVAFRSFDAPCVDGPAVPVAGSRLLLTALRAR